MIQQQQQERLLQHIIDTKTDMELALGYLMYQEVRCMNVVQFKDLFTRNLNGERFDDMVLTCVEKRYNKTRNET